MSCQQTELPLRATHRVSHEQLAADAADLAALLLAHGGPMKCIEIERQRPEWSSGDGRYVRRLAAASGAILSAPGVPYTHLAHCGPELLDRLIAARKAQLRAEGAELVRLMRLRGLCKAAAVLVQTAFPATGHSAQRDAATTSESLQQPAAGNP